ncbi:MAG TPA: sialidase family protein, partial [Pirellulales bacterium]
LAASAAGQSPLLTKTDLFAAGTNGYKTYRIPGLVATGAGTVLAYCEARRSGFGDWDDIDIVLRRSTDGGRTWRETQKIADYGELPANNPAAIADRSGTIHLLHCVNYARCYYLRSTDQGANWSRPVEITDVFERYRPEYNWNVIATGPGHGIQLASGRLVMPVWLSTGGRKHRPSLVSVIYSDDHGASWQRGEILGRELVNPSETEAVELADGGVMLNMRTENIQRRRFLSISANGATGWSQPAPADDLLEPVCMGSMLRWPAGSAPPTLILFSNPNHLGASPSTGAKGISSDRVDLTVHASRDQGRSWPISKLLESGPSGYSDLAATGDGTILCLYERGSRESMYHTRWLTLARLNTAWLESR